MSKLWPIIKSILKQLPLAVALIIIIWFAYVYTNAYLVSKINLGASNALAQIANTVKQGNPFEYTFNFSQNPQQPDEVKVICEQKEDKK